MTRGELGCKACDSVRTMLMSEKERQKDRNIKKGG